MHISLVHKHSKIDSIKYIIIGVTSTLMSPNLKSKAISFLVQPPAPKLVEDTYSIYCFAHAGDTAVNIFVI